jgi:Spy/CpxP family protein refolding chaperone
MTFPGHTRLKVWLVLVVVFILGSITGAALTGLYRLRAGSDRSERNPQQRFEKMRSELSLTDEQTKAVSAILDEARNEYRALRGELRPKFEEPRLKARTKIRALLTSEQQQKFDAIVAHQDAQREGEQKKR